MRQTRFAFVYVALLLTSVARAASHDAAATEHCLARLLVVSGLDGGTGLDLGGDVNVVLVHVADGPSRYFAFSQQGVFTIDQPWPQHRLTFSVRRPDGATQFIWSIAGGHMQSQASHEVKQKADIVVEKFAPLDEPAWAIVRRLVHEKVPRTRALYQESREHAAKKHLPSSVPLGYAESYAVCADPALGDAELTAFVRHERDRFAALVATPVVPVRYDVIRRQDHPEWRACATAAQCAVASGPCGFSDAVAERARSAYAAWATTRGEQIECDEPDEDRVRVSCVAGQCVDPAATPTPDWSRCASDNDCRATSDCGEPLAINAQTLASSGFARWAWFRTVDNWDRCRASTANDSQARCRAGHCELVR